MLQLHNFASQFFRLLYELLALKILHSWAVPFNQVSLITILFYGWVALQVGEVIARFEKKGYTLKGKMQVMQELLILDFLLCVIACSRAFSYFQLTAAFWVHLDRKSRSSA